MQENNTPDLIFNLEAEQAVLGAVLVNNATIARVMFLEPDHFYEPVHIRIYHAILLFWEKGERSTPVTLKNHFDRDESLADVGGAEYLARLAGKATAIINITAYARLLVDLSARRELLELAESLKTASYNMADGKSAQEIIGDANKTLLDISSGAITHKILTSRQVSMDITNGFKEKLTCYSINIPSFDEAMGGGLYEGKAYGIAARKKIGKTLMASTISHNLNLQGVKHLFIAAEMSPEEIQQRNIARTINRNSIAFISKDRENVDFQDKVAKCALADPGNTHYLHIPGISFDEMKRNIALAVYKYGIKGFILDYFQLVGGNGKKTKVEFFDEVAQWIADYCRQEKIWAVVTAQMNQTDNIRWGEGIRLAFDQVYHLQKSEHDENMFFIEMMDTRYTPWREIGSKDFPIIRMEKTGPYFREVE